MNTTRLPAAHAPSSGGAIHALWKERTPLLLESTGQALFGIDMQGRCVFINGAATAQLGWSAEDAIGRNMHALIHHAHRDGGAYAEADCPIFRAFRRGQACRIDDEVLWRRDGSAFEAEYSSYPVIEHTVEGPVIHGAIVTFVDITARRQAEAILRASHDELERRVDERTLALRGRTRELSDALAQVRELAAHLETAREQERTRIAREIHDELGSLLVALKMDTGWLAKRLADREDLRCKCQRMGAMVDRAVDSVGRIITDLRPSILDHQGLWAALEWQAQEFVEGVAAAQEVQVDLKVHVAAGVPPPDGGVAIAVFRIFQEMLSNVARHAQARRVEIAIAVDGPPAPELYLTVRDDGVGAAAAVLDAPRSYGVMGMRERAAHFGGRLSIDSAPGGGTRVRLVMPLPLPTDLPTAEVAS